MSDTKTTTARGRLAPPLARIGVILPTSNRMIEPQFSHYAPVEVGVHFARAQITGPWSRSLDLLAPEIARAANTLADARPDLIVFNCTATSMKEGAKGDEFLLDTIRRETKIDTMSTAQAVIAALRIVGLRKFVLVTPYTQTNNDHEMHYFREFGFDVVHDIGLGLKGGDEFITITPEQWVETALANDRPDSDGFFLACTNTTQIEAIEEIERATGKPVLNSNQAVIWAAINHLRQTIPALPQATIPGALRERTPRVQAAA
jgi:maleate cis-trans isomerase